MADRAFNFSAGPGMLPEPVLRQVQKDIWDIDNTGIGVMEHSHRGPVIDRIFDQTQANLRELASVPDNYDILFLTGGASTQFHMVPQNFLAKGRTADYIHTGVWTKKAIKEAKFFGNVHIAGSSEDRGFCYIPDEASLRFSDNPAYVHLCTNNTIFGTQWKRLPRIPENTWLSADTSSDMLSRPIDVSRYGLIYAGAQKNLGPAGVTLVIIRKDLVEQGEKNLPSLCQYREFAANDSRPNTPPVFSIYVVGEVLKWIKAEGGLEAMAALNERKARPLYDYIDSQDFFRGHAEKDCRSLMNITFRLPTEELESRFIKEADAAGFSGLKGHRSAGGMRASVYNAFPVAGVEALVAFMEKFAKQHAGKATV